MVYRLMQDWRGLLEGSCISEQKFKGVYYLDKCLFEPVLDEEITEWIEVKEQAYIDAYGLEKLLFYSPNEVEAFIKKLKHARYLN